MEISSPRLCELLSALARSPEGLTSEEFRAACYPGSKSSRGTRRVLSELVNRGYSETRGARFMLSQSGLQYLRSASGLAPTQHEQYMADVPAAPVWDEQAFYAELNRAFGGSNGSSTNGHAHDTPWEWRGDAHYCTVSGAAYCCTPDRRMFRLENGFWIPC